MNAAINELLDEAAEVGRVRTDCPDCGSNNTFSAMYLPASMVVIYNCFDASCEIKGSKRVGLQKHQLKTGLFIKPADFKEAVQEEFSADRFERLPISGKAIEYLKKVQCLDLYDQDHIDVRYDSQQDRVVFLVNDIRGGRIVNAVGRTMKVDGKPKWYKYARTSADYKIGWGKIAVIVEDIPSACVVSKLDDVVGISMCGTVLSEILYNYLLQESYDKVLICLDKDAALKSMHICATLKHQMKYVGVLFPERDLKNMDANQLEEFIDQHG